MTDMTTGWPREARMPEHKSSLPGDRLTIDLVEQIVLRAFDLPTDTLRHVTRGRERSARARQVAIYLLHVRLGMTLSASAGAFGRDRTTAAYACRRIEELRENRRIDVRIDQIERAIDSWKTARGVRVPARGRGGER